MAFVPERHSWSSSEEAIFDWILDDDSYYHFDRRALLSNDWNQIGIACDCHTDFGEICIVSLGLDVEPIVESTTNGLRPLEESDKMVLFEARQNRANRELWSANNWDSKYEWPLLRPRYWKECPIGNQTSDICSQIDNNNFVPLANDGSPPV